MGAEAPKSLSELISRPPQGMTREIRPQVPISPGSPLLRFPPSAPPSYRDVRSLPAGRASARLPFAFRWQSATLGVGVPTGGSAWSAQTRSRRRKGAICRGTMFVHPTRSVSGTYSVCARSSSGRSGASCAGASVARGRVSRSRWASSNCRRCLPCRPNSTRFERALVREPRARSVQKLDRDVRFARFAA